MSHWPFDGLSPLQSITEIANNASDVSINEEGINVVASHVLKYIDKTIEEEIFRNAIRKFARYFHVYPDVNDYRAADWIFVLHTLNFSLWSWEGPVQWTVGGVTGFLALCAAIKRAVDEGVPIWNPKYYKDLFQNSANSEFIFRSDYMTRIPFLKERVGLLKEVGKILTTKYGGTFVNCLKLCKDRDALMHLLIKEFPSYEENMSEYKGMKVRFCMKATTLVADLVCFFYEHETFKIQSMFDTTTMFVDFRCIQVFLDFQVLRYSDRLKRKIMTNGTLKFDSAENLEIIACTYVVRKKLHIKLTELLKQYVTNSADKVILIKNTPLDKYEILIDNFLWEYRYKHDEYLKNIVLLHSVKSIYF